MARPSKAHPSLSFPTPVPSSRRRQTRSRISSKFFASQNILRYLKSCRRITNFLLPVDPVALKISDYFDVIQTPMDISTIEQKLVRDEYKTDREILDDMILIFDNAIRFNGDDSDVGEDATILRKEVLRRWNALRGDGDRDTEKSGNDAARSGCLTEPSEDNRTENALNSQNNLSEEARREKAMDADDESCKTTSSAPSSPTRPAPKPKHSLTRIHNARSGRRTKPSEDNRTENALNSQNNLSEAARKEKAVDADDESCKTTSSTPSSPTRPAPKPKHSLTRIHNALSKNTSPPNNNSFIMKKLSPKERQTHLQLLVERQPRHQNNRILNTGTIEDEEDDPFSCDDIQIPSAQSLIEEVLADGISEWKELDSRKIALPKIHHDHPAKRPKVSNDENFSNDENLFPDRPSHSRPYTNHWGSNDPSKRIHLPPNFDYECRSGSDLPPPTTSQKVINLWNPSEHLDYDTELYKLFTNIPTEAELETAVSRKRTKGGVTNHTSKLKKEIARALVEYTRVDCHALGRLRMRDCHHFPFVKRVRGGEERHRQDGNVESDGVVVRMECWREDLRRGSSPDGNRLEMEFFCQSGNTNENTTLLDVHNALVSQYLGVGGNKLHDFDSGSGLFFIEGVFYTAGNVDYVTPILKWLDDPNSDGIQMPRREYLGIPPPPNPIKAMSETELHTLPVRLGVRYVHIFYGDVQSAFFFTDVRQTNRNEIFPGKKARILDCAVVPSTHTICDGCDHCSAVVVCCNDELTDGGPTNMCANCYYEFHYDGEGKLRYNNFEVYSLMDLRVGETSGEEDAAAG